ncbi:MAG: penicillin acylase family protein [Cyclobacteriaceae bacterium]|nr:penicillin acylase family protein [Cyclobacteriaceae bacterium]
MKVARFTFTFFVLSGLLFLSDQKAGPLPPIGKFFSPFYGFWQNAVNNLDEIPASIALNGISEIVDIYYDEHLIPHVFAQNEHDLFYTVGYLNAKHRLWQMEIQAMNAAGRLSEIIGTNTLRHDRMQRRMGILQSAMDMEKEWLQHPELAPMLNSYTLGVNEFINNLKEKDLPIEYKLLDYKPESWSPLKTILVAKNMSALLTLGESDLENTNFASIYGMELFNFLFPDREDDIDPVIPVGTSWKFQTPSSTEPFQHHYLEGNNSRLYKRPSPGLGSNNWVVSGAKTQSGKPILANDMHLGLNLPAIWYQMQLQAPGINTFGHNLPGTPLIITGFNDSIAWGFTNSPRDLVDWYALTLNDQNKTEYLYDGKWMKLQAVVEEIKVRNGETFYDTVYYSHYGPVVFDDSFESRTKKSYSSMQWIAHKLSYEGITFKKLLKARNYTDFRDAIQDFSTPPQNIVFASASGDIALHCQGNIPLRRKNQGKFLIDGSLPGAEWISYIPFEHNPQIFNPDQAFISSANQHQTDENYPYYLYNDFFEYYRNRRINHLLRDMQNITPQDMQNLQLDNYSIKAAEFLPIMLDSLEIDKIPLDKRYIVEGLKKWDYQYEADIPEPVYFELLWESFYGVLWASLDEHQVPLRKPTAFQSYLLLDRLGELREMGFEVKKFTEILHMAFDESLKKIEDAEKTQGGDLRWDAYKNTSIMHMAGIEAFSFTKLSIGGSGDAINAITARHGPSQRLIVAFEGNGVKAWSNYPGGQSGNPGSKYYNNFIKMWENGQYIEILFMKDKKDKSDKIKYTSRLYTPGMQILDH